MKETLFNETFFIKILKMMVICSLFDSSRASSTRMQNFASPISSRIAFRTLLARICKISFWIMGDVYLAFPRTFSKTTLATLSLKVYVNFINSIKLLLFFESRLPSWPLKAQAWKASHQAHSTEVLSRNRLFSNSFDVCFSINLSICRE